MVNAAHVKFDAMQCVMVSVLTSAALIAHADDQLDLPEPTTIAALEQPAANPSNDTRTAFASSLYDRSVPIRPEVRTASRVTAEKTRSLTDASMSPIGADGRPVTELTGVSLRWWLSRGHSDVGFGVGTLGRIMPPTPGVMDNSGALVGNMPMLTLGWRYRTASNSTFFVDAAGARSFSAVDAGNYVNTKVGAEWQVSKSKFGFDRGNLGLSLDSGYRMTVKVRRSGIGIYVRGKF